MRTPAKYARVSTTNPEAFAVCDRCGFWRNRTDLVWQLQWAGMQIYNQQVLVCEDRCYDTPQEQLRTIILPPDPPPVINARVPNFAYEEQTVIITQFADPLKPPAEYPYSSGPEQVLEIQFAGVEDSGLGVVMQYLTSS